MLSDHSPGSGLLDDTAEISPVLVIAFGGLAMRIAAQPPFEFFRLLRAHGSIMKIYLRDHRRAWYHCGVLGVAGGIEGVSATLRQAIDRVEPEKVVTLGTSAGGYAALLFGRLLEVTEIHAFGPQTFISPQLRKRHGDRRFERAMGCLASSSCYRAEYADLNGLLDRTSASSTRCIVHYCEADHLDVAHANHISGRSGVELRRYKDGHHNVVAHLRETGQLQSVLQEIVSPESP